MQNVLFRCLLLCLNLPKWREGIMKLEVGVAGSPD